MVIGTLRLDVRRTTTREGSARPMGGRLRDMIIRGGENIYPVEIENVLRLHPAVAEVAVFGEPDTYYGETVAACLSLRAPISAAELAASLKGRIAAFKLPARYYRVERWPMTASGKIRKRELQEWAAAAKLEPLPCEQRRSGSRPCTRWCPAPRPVPPRSATTASTWCRRPGWLDSSKRQVTASSAIC